MFKYSDLKKNPFIVIIILFLIIVLIKIFITTQFKSPFIFLDEAKYDDIAQNVLNGNLYPLHSFWGTYPPGYSIFLSIAHLLSQDKTVVYHLMLVINVLLTTSIIFPSYFILNKYCPIWISVLGSLVVTTLPIINIYPFTLMSENLFIPLFVYSAWFLHESFENNNKIYEFLTGLSIIFIYMTRSLGLAMLFGFIASYCYYLYINKGKKNILNLIKEKNVLILTFIISIICWMVYTSLFMPPGISYSFGNPYGTESASIIKIVQAFTDISVTKIFMNVAINEINYLILSTYFMVIFFIFICIKPLFNKDNIKGGYNIVLLYYVVAFLLLILISIVEISIGFNVAENKMYGRYIEPLIPLLFIFSIIGISNIKKSHFDLKKSIIYGMAFFIIVSFIILTLYVKNYNVIKTISIYYLYAIYDQITIIILIIIFALSTLGLFILSVMDRKYTLSLLALFICFSIIFSIPAYTTELMLSNIANNEMVQYVKKYSDDSTIIFMNDKDFYGTGMYERASMAFWSKGEVIPVYNLSNELISKDYENKNIYVLSQEELPYKSVANGSWFYRLYKV